MIKFLIFGVNKVPREQMTSIQIVYLLYKHYKVLNTRRKQIYLKIKPKKNSLKEFVKESKQVSDVSNITTQIPVSKNPPSPISTVKRYGKPITTKKINLDDAVREKYPEFDIFLSNYSQRTSTCDAVIINVRLKGFTYCSESITSSQGIIGYAELLNKVKSLTQRVEARNAKLLPLTYEYCKPLIPIGYKFILETLHDTTCLRCTIYKDDYKINEVVTFNIVNLGESLDRELHRIVKQIVARYQISRRSGRNYYGYW